MERVFLLSLQVLSETFLIMGRIDRDTIKNVYWSSCELSDILVGNFNFLN